MKIVVIENMSKTKDRLQEFSEFLENNFDSSFYAQYRPKPDNYFFFYWQNNTIHGSFTPTDSIRKIFKQRAELWHLDEIIKYGRENFFRFGLVDNGNKIAQILVLKKGETVFNYSTDSKLNNLEILSSLQDIKYYGSSFIYKMTDSIMIYFI